MVSQFAGSKAILGICITLLVVRCNTNILLFGVMGITVKQVQLERCHTPIPIGVTVRHSLTSPFDILIELVFKEQRFSTWRPYAHIVPKAARDLA